MKKIIIFGCGPTGAIIARRAAEMNYQVTIYEVRDHIAGNLYDYLDEESGVIVHKYGPHIMQTSDDLVIDFIKQYSNWFEFRHKVNVVIDGKEVPLPINFKSIDELFDDSEKLKDILKSEFKNLEKISILDLKNNENEDLNKMANYIYENVFENYTTKMWGIEPEDIDQSVLARVPIRLSYDDGYFDDKFQAVPTDGYTKFIENILNHKNINVILNAPKDLLSIMDGETFIDGVLTSEEIIYTGPVDKLFDYKYGDVPYRSLKFEFQNVDKDKYQERPVVNYPSHPIMTRITDYALLSGKYYNEKTEKTVIGKEYPGQYDLNSVDFKEPYYPINNDENNLIIKKYMDEIDKINNLSVIGRLAEYKYKQMAHAIKDALEFKI